MSKLPDPDTGYGVAIEHVTPLASNPDDPEPALDYQNMLAVCGGNSCYKTDKKHRCKGYMTCDRAKGNKSFKKLNPFDADTLKDIGYSPDGTIFSLDEAVNADLNDVLNLNQGCKTSDGSYARMLREKRRNVYLKTQAEVKKMLEECNKEFEPSLADDMFEERIIELLGEYRNEGEHKLNMSASSCGFLKMSK